MLALFFGSVAGAGDLTPLELLVVTAAAADGTMASTSAVALSAPAEGSGHLPSAAPAWADLPSECLLLVMRGLSLEELIAAGGKCTGWRAASLATPFSVELSLSEGSREQDERRLQAFMKEVSGVGWFGGLRVGCSLPVLW